METEKVDFAEIEAELNSLQERANELRSKRDNLNSELGRFRGEKAKLSQGVRQLISEGLTHKENRDKINHEVAKLKDDKQEIEKEYRKIIKKIKKAEKEILTAGEVPIENLKKEAKRVEFDQMTKVLTIKDEKKLIEEYSRITKKIAEREKQIKQNEVLGALENEADEIKKKLKTIQTEIMKKADEAQEEHEKYTHCIKKTNELGEKIRVVQANLTSAKERADYVHKEYIDQVNQLKELERKLNELKTMEKKTKQTVAEEKMLKDALEIYKDFKSGKKLSTRDLIILQKTGLI
jgi:phosphoserine phosphatase